MPSDMKDDSCATGNDLERLKKDLGALRQAVGLEPPFGREDIRAHLAIAASGAVTLLWALLPTGLPAQWGIVPLIAVVLGYVIWMRTRYRNSSGRSPTRRREYTSGLVGMVVVGALALVYRNWAGALQIPPTVAGGALLFVFGITMLVPVLRDRNRLSDLGIAVPLIACGLVIPLWSVSPWVVLGITFGVGGLATAALMEHQLRSVVEDHAAN